MIVHTSTVDSRLRDWISEHKPERIVMVVSKTSRELCLPKLEIHHNINMLIYEVPNGEAAKDIEICQDFWELLLRENISRNSVIIALGGGAVLDFGGFCASVYMRGIPFVYVPTTLLSMVDGSEGGKTGINFYGNKNIIGTFKNPSKIIRNVDFIQTLPELEVFSAWAEITKHGILAGGSLWNRIESKIIPALTDENTWMDIVIENITYKQAIVQADFEEKGTRKLLNLGHTLGHTIEALYFEEPFITHGICVANGLYWEALLGVELGITKPETLTQITDVLFPMYRKIHWDSTEVDQMVAFLRHDKKNSEGNIQFTMVETIGNCHINYAVDEADITAFLYKHALDNHA
jgi:3-dehydroquinate synthase